MATLSALRAELAALEALRRTGATLTAAQLRRMHILRTMVGGSSGHGSLL